MTKHAVIKLSLRAVIAGEEFNDILQYSSTFALNSIPTGVLSIAVGRSIEDDNQLATIHTTANSLRIQQDVEVFLTADVGIPDRTIPGVPNKEEIKIFKGKIVGAGWHRTAEGANFTIHMLHWLGALNYASAIAASSHPGNPSDFTYPAIFGVIGNPGAAPASGLTRWLPPVTKELVNAASLSDIWGNILHTWMRETAASDPFDAQMLKGDGTAVDPDIIDAIDRIGPSEYGAKLNLLKLGVADDVVASGIIKALKQESGGNWINTTLWGKLIGDWAPAYRFAVAPRVEDALVIPYTPSLKGEPWSVIGDEDYDMANLNTQLNQVLRGVGMVHPMKSTSGLDLNKSFIPADRGGFASYYSPSKDKTGMVLIKSPPRWLTDPISEHFHSAQAEGMDNAPIGTAQDEDGVGQDNAPAAVFTERFKGYQSIISRYAEQWYITEALKGRVGEIGGKLRFDIAPGSSVKIEAGTVPQFRNEVVTSSDVYATVIQVAYTISAQNQTAGTAFGVSHIRTDAENTEPGFSMAGHALYDTSWQGAKLIEHDGIGVEKLVQ